jgi:hypothetical protein
MNEAAELDPAEKRPSVTCTVTYRETIREARNGRRLLERLPYLEPNAPPVFSAPDVPGVRDDG